MTEKRKASAGTAIPTLAVESGRVCETVRPSTKNDTTDGAGRQAFRVADLLHPGAENAVPRRDLMALTGFTDRELRRQIEAERRQGVPILSNCVGGYFLPGDEAERKRFLNSMLHRAMEIAAVAAAVEQAEV